MLFTQAMLARIERGEIAMAFRRWRRPTVRAGGRLRTPVGELAIDAVEVIQPADISDADALAAGFASREALLAGVGAGGETLYRIRFRHVGDDTRKALAAEALLLPDELTRITTALRRLDRRGDGAWPMECLELVGRSPGRPSRDLASELDLDAPLVKRRMRMLKELGLIESLATGYKLSPRGQAYVGQRPGSRPAR